MFYHKTLNITKTEQHFEASLLISTKTRKQKGLYIYYIILYIYIWTVFSIMFFTELILLRAHLKSSSLCSSASFSQTKSFPPPSYFPFFPATYPTSPVNLFPSLICQPWKHLCTTLQSPEIPSVLSHPLKYHLSLLVIPSPEIPAREVVSVCCCGWCLTHTHRPVYFYLYHFWWDKKGV